MKRYLLLTTAVARVRPVSLRFARRVLDEAQLRLDAINYALRQRAARKWRPIKAA